jgi:hypothetical protein
MKKKEILKLETEIKLQIASLDLSLEFMGDGLIFERLKLLESKLEFERIMNELKRRRGYVDEAVA